MAKKRKAQSNEPSKASRKKAKNLENYINKKLQKDRRHELLEGLSKSQFKDTGALQSSASLGSHVKGKAKTVDQQTEQAQQVADRARQRALQKRFQNQELIHSDEEEEEDDEQNDSDNDDVDDKYETEAKVSKNNNIKDKDANKKKDKIESKSNETFSPSNLSSVGTGLAKDSSTGQSIKPVVVQKKPKKKRQFTFQQFKKPEPYKKESSESDEEESDFDSSASSNAGSISDSEPGSDSDLGSQSHSESLISEHQSKTTVPPQQKSIPKKSSFASWATQQLNQASNNYNSPDESTTIDTTTESTINNQTQTSQPPPSQQERQQQQQQQKKKHNSIGPMGEKLKISKDSLLTSEKAFFVPVNRSKSIQDARLNLPVLAEEEPIMDAIRQNPVVVICGETGSGKTTQLPQFLFEAGYGSSGSSNPGMICITQPRRLAAISMASRVATELNLPSSRVSYQIRYDATVSPETSIKFVTDGVLLRELAQDFLLSKYSAILVDEAHERSVNTDVVIGVLSRVVKLRLEMYKSGNHNNIKPLRLIIMSATLRVQDFTENKTLFESPPPIIKVDARQYSVTTHFSKRTEPDYITQAFRKVSKIHARLPPGAILVFVTGQNEIHDLCRKLQRRFGRIKQGKSLPSKPSKNKNQNRQNMIKRKSFRNDATDEEDIKSDDDNDTSSKTEEDNDVDTDEATLISMRTDTIADSIRQNELDRRHDSESAADDSELSEGHLDTTDDEDDEDRNNSSNNVDDDENYSHAGPMHVLPLYAMLPAERQSKVFEEQPEGIRLVVVATNVAETSLTIPGIRYVVDSGRAKEKHYDNSTGIESFSVSWISKASASQRAGRAGRTGPGHCYRLYSSAVYEDYFDQHSIPEILRMPIDGLVLQMKSMNLDSVVNFPFPTPPDRHGLKKAELDLIHLNALSPLNTAAAGRITALGKSMACFPLQPRLSKMLVAGQQHGCLPFVIVIVCALSVGSPFLREEDVGGEISKSDMDSILSSDFAQLDQIRDPEERVKEERRLVRKAFFQSQQRHAALGDNTSDILKVLSVVGAYLYHTGPSIEFCRKHFVRAKAMEEIVKLRAQICKLVMVHFPNVDVGFTNKLSPPTEKQLKVLKQLLTSAYIDQIAVRKDIVEKTAREAALDGTQMTYRALNIDQDVFLHNTSCLSSRDSVPPPFVIFKEAQQTEKRTYIKELTKINPNWIPELGKTMCTFSRGQVGKEVMKNGKLTREVSIVATYGGKGLQVELPAQTITEKRIGGRWTQE